MNPATIETARRVRELAPGPETGAAVRAFIARGSGSLDDFLAGMLAALDPASALSQAVAQTAAQPEPEEAAEAPKEATGARPGEITKASSASDVLWFCRERLGLREDGEGGPDAAHRRKYIGTFEDRTDEGDGVWIFFSRRPKADVRAKLKPTRETGWRYMGKDFGYGWRHLCGQAQKREAKAA